MRRTKFICAKESILRMRMRTTGRGSARSGPTSTSADLSQKKNNGKGKVFLCFWWSNGQGEEVSRSPAQPSSGGICQVPDTPPHELFVGRFLRIYSVSGRAMSEPDLSAIAKRLCRPGHGLLASDESTATIGKRLAKAGLDGSKLVGGQEVPAQITGFS